MRLQIRPLQLSDIGQLGRLLRSFADEMGQEVYPIMDAEEIEAQLIFIVETINNPLTLYLVAIDGKKLVGWFFGEYIIRRFGKPRLSGCAREMYVVPSKRGKGIGTTFFRMAVQAALKANVGSVEQLGLPGRTQARWEKLGFKSYLVHGYMNNDLAAKVTKEKPSEDLRENRHRHPNRPTGSTDLPRA